MDGAGLEAVKPFQKKRWLLRLRCGSSRTASRREEVKEKEKEEEKDEERGV